MAAKVKIELATARKLRDRNKASYRLAHWPIWIWVFFLAPGPLTFQLFAYGFNAYKGYAIDRQPDGKFVLTGASYAPAGRRYRSSWS